jgi:hypothetical protein
MLDIDLVDVVLDILFDYLEDTDTDELIDDDDVELVAEILYNLTEKPEEDLDSDSDSDSDYLLFQYDEDILDILLDFLNQKEEEEDLDLDDEFFSELFDEAEAYNS